ncbi:biopolymer transporter ExbD [bacterium]|nr:biopolymer transporter ExbD [bacterium]
MTFRSQIEIARGRIDAAPMVDVVFLLLIFFILSSSFVLQPGFKVDLQPSAVKSPGSLQALVVTVTRTGLIFFNERQSTLDLLGQSLRAVERPQAQELIIKADRQVPHGTVVEIMSLAAAAGISSVNIATRPAAVEPSEVGLR